MVDLGTDISWRSHYLPTTEDDQGAMLEAIGVAELEDLFADIPADYRNPTLDLPGPLSELELRREMDAYASRNRHAGEYACFLGAGAYNHFTPSVVRALISRGEFLTSYTPYQPEISQGTLQATYEFQSMICSIYDMEVANAGLYDGASALAEAALMACRVTGRSLIGACNTISPAYREVLETYCVPQGLEIATVDPEATELHPQTACLVSQYPNFFGYLEDLERYRHMSDAVRALMVVSSDPVAMAMLRPPGSFGADMVTGEGQALGLPLSFGGPYVGLFSTRQALLRQMPGRLAGGTTDRDGRPGFVLTLSTREQHIRRERATSNICTNQALMALAATIYTAALGKRGLRQVAEQAYHKAHYAAGSIASLPGYGLPLQGTFAFEFPITCPAPASEINAHLLEHGIIGGLDIGNSFPNGMLLCVTEVNTREEIDSLVDALAEFKP